MTNLPTSYDPKAIEPAIAQRWEKAGCFHAEPGVPAEQPLNKGVSSTSDSQPLSPNPQPPSYAIVIPPPNVTGALHMGHALNNVAQDICIRHHRMKGETTCWLPGTDHAGIATQAVVERLLLEKEGKTRHDVGREALVQRIWDWKDKFGGRILQQLRALGCSCDWPRTRFTMDDQCSKAVREAFFRLFADGLIYRGKRLVNWDCHLQTAVADDEIEQVDRKSEFYHIRYPVNRRTGILPVTPNDRGTGRMPVTSVPSSTADVFLPSMQLSHEAPPRRHLPHLHAYQATYFVTFRLCDSLPKAILDSWLADREIWCKNHPHPWTEAQEEEYHQLFGERINRHLDAGHGTCWLHRKDVAEMVEKALLHFDGERYALGHYVIMPNHVHVLVKPYPNHTLSEILHSWKSYTALEANRLLGRGGTFWQDESFDHVVRHYQSFLAIRDYIQDNPKSAALIANETILGCGRLRLGEETRSADSLQWQKDRQDACPTYVLIATTRPESMLGDTAVAVHPEPRRELEHRENELLKEWETATDKEKREIQTRLDSLRKRKEEMLPILEQMAELVKQGAKLVLPLVGREIPLIADHHADPEKGTGAVKITPAHDPNDYLVGQRHNLPMINILNPNGSMNEVGAGEFNGEKFSYVGLDRFEARKRIVSDLERLGLLEKIEQINNTLPLSDRSKTPIEPYLSEQWFVKMGDDPRGTGILPVIPSCGTGVPPVTFSPFNPQQETEKKTRNPPHWRQQNKTYFITFRLADSLPQEKMLDWLTELNSWQRNHPEPHNEMEQYELWSLHEKIEKLLDTNYGECWLKRPEILSIIETALKHFDGERYALGDYVIMPNHVHVLFTPYPEHEVSGILHSWKSFTAKACNQILGRAGTFWQDESFERIVRNESAMRRHQEYIKNNPKQAGLKEGHYRIGCGLLRNILENMDETPAIQKSVTGKMPVPHETITGETPVPRGLAQMSIDAVIHGQVKFFPERFEKTYFDWLREKRDWCISRQLWWGHRIPVWSRKLNGNSSDLPAEPDRLACQTVNNVQYVCLRYESDLELQTQLESAGFVRDPDVLDTWFSSALWPLSTLGWPEEAPEVTTWYPSNVLITDRGIITLWVARMVMFGLYLRGQVPFHHVHVHAKILDGEGVTMSKSKGNGIDPIDLIDRFGTDGLRYTLADLMTGTQDIRLPVQMICPHCGHEFTNPSGKKEVVTCPNKTCGKPMTRPVGIATGSPEAPLAKVTSEKFEIGRNFINKFWNAGRFVLMNLGSSNEYRVTSNEENSSLVRTSTSLLSTRYPSLPIEDRWILSRLQHAIRTVSAKIDIYEFSGAIDVFRAFFWGEFCDWYLELVKPRLSSTELSTADPRPVLAKVFDQALRLLHPFCPFITEELFARLNELEGGPEPKDQLLANAEWPTFNPDLVNEDAEEQVGLAITLTKAIREVRASQNIPPAQKLDVVLAAGCERLKEAQRTGYPPFLARMAPAGEVRIDPQAKKPRDAAVALAGGITIYVLGAVDPTAERARLEKLSAEVQKRIANLKGRLDKPGYVERAPAKQVAETRAQLQSAEEELSRVQSSLAEMG